VKFCRRSTSDPAPVSTAATMPDPVADPAAFDAWAANLPKATQADRGGGGIVNTGTMQGVQNNPGARGGRQVSNGRVNQDRG
jgi:hypothetical protein